MTDLWVDSILTSDWFSSPALQKVFEVIEVDGDRLRAVGGCVRNTLLGVPVMDIDLATTALPDQVIERCREAGLKTIPTGIDHGTVTVRSQGTSFEVTTLRQDVGTDGRRADVQFGRDWQRDAERRDFTMNALYVDRSGQIIDLVGGLADLENRHVRFIGDASVRIREDYLRILRFFRFSASYGGGHFDEEGLAASKTLRDGLQSLSGERIGQEMKKLVLTSYALEALDRMKSRGVLAALNLSPVFLDRTRLLLEFFEKTGIERRVTVMLACLFCQGGPDGTPNSVQTVARCMRLSNAESGAMKKAISLAELAYDRDELCRKEILYRHGVQAYLDGLSCQIARNDASAIPDWGLDAARLPDRWEAPEFPIAGRDLMERGMEPGPEIGARLVELEMRWIESDFTLDVETLLSGDY